MIIENKTSEQNSKLFRLFFLLSTTLYSLLGIFYFQWSIFYFVYLFWFENFIKAIFLYIKVKSTNYIEEPGINRIENGRQQAYGSPASAAKGRIFINCLYFVFIVFGLGVFVLFIFGGKDGVKNFMDVLNIIFFRNNEFNIVLLFLLTKEITEYLQDFVISKKYNEKNKMKFPDVFAKNDIVLHCSIIFGLGGSLVLHNPDIGGKYGLDQSPWANYSMALALIIFKLITGLYEISKSKSPEKQEEERQEMMEL